MDSKEFYKKIDEHINKIKQDELVDFVNNLVRKIPEDKFKEVLCMMSPDDECVSSDKIEDMTKYYKEKFNEIEECKLYFNIVEDDDYYDEYWDEYFDEYGIGKIIDNAIKYAENLVNFKKYSEAKELFDIILYTHYFVYGEYIEYEKELSLSDLSLNELINSNVNIVCLNAIYVTYQISNNRVEDIYNYFRTNENFKDISIENAFKLGTEKLTDIDNFYTNWIDLLSKTKGIVECRLLKEALNYTNYSGYEKYINQIKENQPEFYIDLFDHLKKENKIQELVKIGNNALKTMDDNLKVGSKIALYLASLDKQNIEYYLCEAFKFDSNVLNLLRIINNGYYKKNKDKINNMINDNYQKIGEEYNSYSKQKYSILQFFTGDFDFFYNECTRHNELLGWSYSFIKIAVYMWILLLNDNSNSRSYKKMSSDFFSYSYIEYSRSDKSFLEGTINEIWKNWKSNFKIDEVTKTKVINWLLDLVEKRVGAVLGGNYRKSYDQVALTVVGFGELLSSQKLGDKDEYIKQYLDKYPRHSAFRNELNNII